MEHYHKIQTVFLRDPDNRNRTLLEGQFAKPEFEYLQHNNWEFTEKVNGTNVRLIWDGVDVDFRGKTDDAQMSTKLLRVLRDMFPVAKLKDVFYETPVCLYGEGYGAGIIKGGGNYRQDNSFVLLDVLIDTWWLQRENVVDIATKLGIDVVPIISKGTLHDMVKLCREGFQSTWGDFQAEGLVGRPEVQLFNRKGERVITKLKCKDFPRQ